MKSGCRSCNLWFQNQDDGDGFQVKRFFHWAWNARMIFFFLGDMKVADAKKKFDVGDEIVVSNENIGNSVEDNLELTHVYVHQNHQVNHWASHQLWYGTTLHANIYVSAVAKNNVPRSVCF